MKLRLVRLNPLTLDPGSFVLMGARQLANGVISQFPVRLEYQGSDVDEWHPAEFTNEFITDENNDTREVRPKVQVPIYNEPARNKRSGSRKRDGST